MKGPWKGCFQRSRTQDDTDCVFRSDYFGYNVTKPVSEQLELELVPAIDEVVDLKASGAGSAIAGERLRLASETGSEPFFEPEALLREGHVVSPKAVRTEAGVRRGFEVMGD